MRNKILAIAAIAGVIGAPIAAQAQSVVTTGVAPGGTGTSTVTVNSTEAAQTPALGLMVVTLDNKSGHEEAQLIPINAK